jgi:hypothetical protein
MNATSEVLQVKTIVTDAVEQRVDIVISASNSGDVASIL